MNQLSNSILVGCLLLYGGNLPADDSHFRVSPKKCVTLKQGSQCYQDIRVQWQSSTPGDYCLKLENNDEPLQCWQSAISGQYKFEFIGHESTRIGLIQQQSNQTINDALIEVKWVYKNRSRGLNWRVF